MLLKEVVQLVLAAIVLLSRSTEAAPMASVKLCGRQLSEIMSRVCHAYNSPSWDVPTGTASYSAPRLASARQQRLSRPLEATRFAIVEQPGVVARRKRQLGIADECCVLGCTWEQLSEYCSISAYSESPLEDMDSHIIADRSAEQSVNSKPEAPTVPAMAAGIGAGAGDVRDRRREVGRRTRGYGLGRSCWCRRKRRSGRRRSSLIGNMSLIKSARAAPVVGTVSPLITWGRTLNTDLPTADRDRYAYVVHT